MQSTKSRSLARNLTAAHLAVLTVTVALATACGDVYETEGGGDEVFGQSEQALILHKDAATGQRFQWSREQRRELSYCISSADFDNSSCMMLTGDGFTTCYERLRTTLQRAASAWENAADVRFVHRTSEDSRCDSTNGNVLFIVTKNAGDAEAWPGWNPGPSPHVLAIGTQRVRVSPEWHLLSAYQHEFGHVLGFEHEHARVYDPTHSICNENPSYEALTGIDYASAMYYDFCFGNTDASRQVNYLTQWDVEGAQSVYEAPTNVVYGRQFYDKVYARQRSTGDIYQRWATGPANAPWVRLGGPGQSFALIGGMLYGHGPGRGESQQQLYAGLWRSVGSAAGQILRCGDDLCATAPESGDLWQRRNGTWKRIGGAGSRFASTSKGELFAITPHQDAIMRWSGVGTAWFNIGSPPVTHTGLTGASELFGGGAKMYALTRNRDAIFRYDGGHQWTRVGGPGRQFLATGDYLYAIVPDGNAVVEFVGNAWVPIGGPATRLYGSDGYLLATNANGDIYRYERQTGNWIGLGQP